MNAHIHVPGTLESLDEIRRFIRQAGEDAAIDRKRIYRLQLAVDEIATNIANYGYRAGELAGEIEVRAETEPDKLVITLIDTSPAFDPFSKATPDSLDDPLLDRPIGGLGIYLALENVDEFRYDNSDGKNHNIFVVRRSNGDG